jgi:peptide/nickel transport system substrate-binding protein
MSTQTLSRRTFLRAAAMTAAGAAMAACQPQTVIVKETVEVEKEVEKVVKETVVVEKEVEKEVQVTKIVEKEVEKIVEVTVMPEEVKESPGLFTMVAQGKLPPVAERVSMEPRVMQVEEEIGQYGGTWRRVSIGPGDVGVINSRLSYASPLRYTNMADEIVPHIAKEWEVGGGGSEFTFYLRKGMKYSDGEPYNADNWVFYFEDVEMNTELRAGGPRDYLQAGGENATLEKLDDYSFKIKFGTSSGLFIPKIASTHGYNSDRFCCKHYLSQFHADYADKAELDKKIKDAGFENWWDYIGDRWNAYNVELPHTWSWQPTKMPPDVPCVDERNPYSWIVDPEGNQLPYIDRRRYEVVENIDILNLKAVAGAVDHQFRHLSWENFPLFVENAEAGDYRIVQWTLARGADCCLHFNLNVEDPGKRELFETKEFRQALSLAIDRDEVNEVVYMGMGVPRQASVLPSDPHFKPEQATAYAEFDPDTANQMLDDIGLTARDAEGFRLNLQGESFAVNIEYAPVFGPWADVLQMVAGYWGDVGVKTLPQEMSRPLFSERGSAGTVQDMSVWTMDRSAHFLVDPLYQMPRRGGTPASTGALYRDWWESDGEQGEEPPPEVKKAYELYDKCVTAGSTEELAEYATELLDLNAEQLWFVGVVGLLPHVGVVKNPFRNVPEEAVSDWLCLTPGNTSIEQYFFKEL